MLPWIGSFGDFLVLLYQPVSTVFVVLLLVINSQVILH